MFWNLYFLTKFYLYFKGTLQFSILYNFLLVAYWLLPWLITKATRKIRLSATFNRAHGITGVLLAFLLFWHDSYFPPISALVQFISDEVTRPTLAYTLSFLAGYWNTIDFLIIILLLGVCIWVKRKDWNLAPLIFVLLIIPPARMMRETSHSVTDVEHEFYANQESERKIVRIQKPKADSIPFDIVIVQVCSLSWDDLKQVGMDHDPFFSNFDILFTRFNTATSYSTPAALRLLRSNCGQARHQALYQEASQDCYLMESLRQAGFATQTVFNNEGKLASQMAEQIQRWGKADAPMSFSGLAPEAVNFDNSRLYNNFNLLDQWWKKRIQSHAERNAVFYNTVSLHGGSHSIHDQHQWWKRPRTDVYKESVTRLFSDLTKFFSELQESGKDVLVIMVPEHGAALVGDSIQAPDLRDIPLPKITTVPMGVKFIHQGRTAGPVRKINRLVSYQAISTVISETLQRSSNGNFAPLSEEALNAVPEISFFTENENAATTIRGQELYYRGQDLAWKALSKSLVPVMDNSTN